MESETSMSGTDPMEFNNEPYATNTLVMHRYVGWYIILFWLSTLFPMYLFYDFFFVQWPKWPTLFMFMLPIMIFGMWVVFILMSIFFSRIFLSIVNLLHKPREGVFIRSRQDKDYRYWSLRATIKKYAFWAAHTFPLVWMDVLAFKMFDVKTRMGTAFFNAWVDSEFLEVGDNAMIGLGAVVLSAAVVGDYFIIKKTKIGDSVLIGAHAIVMPGTVIEDNAILGAMSSTTIGQKLEAGWTYMGTPAKKFKENKYSVNKDYKGKDKRIEREETTVGAYRDIGKQSEKKENPES